MDRDRYRFQVELEFVQCLSNPKYVHYLAQNGHLQDRGFIRYLEYLRYWKQPKYAKFLIYPQSLYFLDRLVEDAEFRQSMSRPDYQESIHKQQFYHWRFSRYLPASSDTTLSS